MYIFSCTPIPWEMPCKFSPAHPFIGRCHAHFLLHTHSLGDAVYIFSYTPIPWEMPCTFSPAHPFVKKNVLLSSFLYFSLFCSLSCSSKMSIQSAHKLRTSPLNMLASSHHHMQHSAQQNHYIKQGVFGRGVSCTFCPLRLTNKCTSEV